MDVIPDGQPRPRWVALYELGLFLHTASGRVHPLAAYLDWLHDAGFEPPERSHMVSSPLLAHEVVAWLGAAAGVESESLPQAASSRAATISRTGNLRRVLIPRTSMSCSTGRRIRLHTFVFNS